MAGSATAAGDVEYSVDITSKYKADVQDILQQDTDVKCTVKIKAPDGGAVKATRTVAVMVSLSRYRKLLEYERRCLAEERMREEKAVNKGDYDDIIEALSRTVNGGK